MISFALPTNNIGTIAITFNSFWVEPQLMTGEGSPEGLGMTSSQPSLFSPTHFQLKASYANKIFNSLAVGVSLSWLNISHSGIPVGQESGLGETSAVLVDLGILMNDLLPNATYIKPSKLKSDLICNEEKSGFAFGLSLLNFGPKIFFIDRNQEDPLPSRILFGLSYWALSTDLISAKLALDFENRIYDSDSFDYIHIGSDFQFYKVFSLRAGYVVNNIDSDLSYFTMGVGAKIKYASFNIARYTKFITPTWNFDIRINYEI